MPSYLFDAQQAQPTSEMEVALIQMLRRGELLVGSRDVNSNPTITGPGGDVLVVSADGPNDADGRPDGTIWIQTA